MSSPSDGCGLFFSSSPTRYSSGQAEEVNTILAQALSVTQLDPAFQLIFVTNPDAFFETFSRRVELIKSRSQAFQDSHITVFDKVLLALTQNGNDLENPAAITYFCVEFLGTPNHATFAQKRAILSNATIAHEALTRAMTPPETQRGSLSARGANSKSPEKNVDVVQAIEEQKKDILASLAAQIDQFTVRLWDLYTTAKSEFQAITDLNSLEKQNAAKFLRDTAENTLHHLQGKNPDQRLLDELDVTLAVAKHTAMTLHGGKKRKFDHPTRSRPHSSTSSARIGRSRPLDSMRINSRTHEQTRASDDAAQNGSVSRHARGRDHRRLESGSNRRHEDWFAQPELSPKDVQKRKRKPPGRGHSGIPFGYTRPVDSYCPS